MFLPAVLPLFHLIHGFDVFWNNELPIAKALAEHFLSFPTEQTLRRGRPAQHAKLAIPFDHGEWRVLNVERETPVLVNRSCLGEFAFGHIANDGDAADDLTLFIMTWRIVTIEETVTT